MAEHGVAALSHVPSGERVRTGPADPSGAWDQEHSPSMETTTQESGLRENRTSRLSERTEEGRKPDLLRLYRSSSRRFCQGSRQRLWPTRAWLGIGPPLTKGGADAVLGLWVAGHHGATRAHRPGLSEV